MVLAERLGHTAKPLERGVLVTFGDLKSRLYFNPEHKVLSFISHFSGYRAGWALVNAWNRDHRFGRAFIDEDGDVAIETELDLEPGVRLEALVSWARSYGVLIALFHGALQEAQGGEGGGKGRGAKGARRGKRM
ncbi:MAG: YbjN domain-containing protein [Deltaproteobacteria bacterium]|nr:YbjN domain-containing protein [Deltaproteobacteria bacterium]